MAAKRCVTSAALPRYSAERGWYGGAKKTLFTITDQRTGHMRVLPIHDLKRVGPAVNIRVATRTEAEQHWQKPLHSGWRVKC